MAPGLPIIGRYRLLKPLGEGAFGAVFLAHDQESNEICALKILKSTTDDDGEGQSLFKTEAKLWLSIDPHPHVVSALAVDVFNERLTLALEFIPPNEEGIGTLQSLIAARRVNPTTALRLVIQICEGLKHAQEQGLHAHRDIKPANILVDASGHAKVSDFGLAQFSSSRWETLDLQRNTTGGTLLYMAPEQFLRPDVDHRADIYAVGIIAYELLTGRFPYDISHIGGPAAAQQIFQLHQSGTPAPLKEPEWPTIEKCLAADLNSRPKTYIELLTSLYGLFQKRAGRPYQSIPKAQYAAHTLINKSASFSLLGEPRIALALLEQAIKLAPGLPIIDVNRGALLAQMGNIQAALQLWQTVAAKYPETSRAHYNLGNFHLISQAYERAINCYTRCLEFEIDYVPAIVNKAIALAKLGKLDHARETYQEALHVCPTDAQVHYNYGVFLFDHELITPAKEALMTCIQLNPRHKSAYNYLGNCDRALGQVESARSWYKKALTIDPTYSYALKNLEELSPNP